MMKVAMEMKPSHKKAMYIKEEKGNIAVIVAISLVVLVGMLALVVDGGNLYMTRDRYQNGVEAAALAGANHICDGEYETVARLIASDNNIPHEYPYLSVEIGYYDFGDEYEDFDEYRDFLADIDAGTSYNDGLSEPDDEQYVYNNAVKVSLNAEVTTFLAGLFGKEQMAVSAEAVGVARRVGLLSFGDDPDTSGILIDNWDYMSADFRNAGVIHANTDVNFDNNAAGYVSLSGDTLVTATGEVVDCPEGGASLSGEDVIYPETSLEDIMENLKVKAESQGTLIPLDDEHFPSEGLYDEDGNYYGSQGIAYVFGPYDGNHDGAVYYFEGTTRLGIKTPGGAHAVALTIASESNLVFTSVVGGSDDLFLGGNGYDMAYVYTTGNVGGDNGEWLPNYWGALGDHCFDGVFFRVGGLFGIRPSDGQNSTYEHKLRIIAEGTINIEAASVPPFTFYFGADFGPPCPPIKVGLGTLELAVE